MFGAKYSRLTFWIWSVLLLLPFSILATFSKATEMSSELAQTNLGFRALLFIIIIMWMNALANRVRDYGSNPWISVFSLIPLANIGLALYYGIAKSKDNSKKNENQDQNNSNISLVKAVYNHSKDISSGVKPAISEYKQQHTTSQTQTENPHIDLVNEDSIYEQVMLEIEEDRKVKSTWAKALAQSDGDREKTEALYIKLRVQNIIEATEEKSLKNSEAEKIIIEIDSIEDLKEKKEEEKKSGNNMFIIIIILLSLILGGGILSNTEDVARIYDKYIQQNMLLNKNNNLVKNSYKPNDVKWYFSQEKMNFSDAKKYCENLQTTLGDDWRLPTSKEFENVLNSEVYYAYGDYKSFEEYASKHLKQAKEHFQKIKKNQKQSKKGSSILVEEEYINYFPLINDSENNLAANFWVSNERDREYAMDIDVRVGAAWWVEKTRLNYFSCIKN